MLLTTIRRSPTPLTLAPLTKRGLPDDRNVRELAYRQLEEHTHFRGHLSSIFIEVREGTLILEGRLPSFYLKQILQTALREIPGVQKIKNRVDVISPYGLSSVKYQNPGDSP